MNGCPACGGVPGAQHSCPSSGTWKAAEAHLAGEVDEIAADWTVFGVHLNFQVRAIDEEMVRKKLTGLVIELLTDDLVEHADFSIVELEGVAA